MQHSSKNSTLRVLLLVLVTVALACACSRTPPEQAVRNQLQALQAAIDARDAKAVNGLIAEEFVGNDGIDRRGVRQLALGLFMRHRDVGARLGPVTVTLRGDSDAVAKFSVFATGGSGGLLPDSGQVFEVETGWRLLDGEWRLLTATWSPPL